MTLLERANMADLAYQAAYGDRMYEELRVKAVLVAGGSPDLSLLKKLLDTENDAALYSRLLIEAYAPNS
jgi:hypothetical protein